MDLRPRQREIHDRLHDGQPLGIEQVAVRFGVSAQTIRRDVQDLDDQGLVRRHRGTRNAALRSTCASRPC